MEALETSQIEHFVERGYLRLDETFPKHVAERGCEILWRDTVCDPLDRSTWTRPVIWLWDYDQEPFHQAVNMPLLHTAFDQLVGKGRWLPRQSLGTFPVRFPSQSDSGDTGWHVDASFPGEDSSPNDFLSWRVNVRSRGRALLMLSLFSDVGEQDAPTRIRVGSHLGSPGCLRLLGRRGYAQESWTTARLLIVMKSWAPARQERSICATLSWSIPLKLIEERIRDSWPNRLSFPLNHWTWTGLMPWPTRLSNGPSAEDWDGSSLGRSVCIKSPAENGAIVTSRMRPWSR
jgi:hypothetical protein